MSQNALLRAWENTVRSSGRRRAIVQAADGESVTFAELDQRADRWLTANISEPEQVRGRPVVFSAGNGIGWFEIFLGLLKAGAVIVPLDPAEPAGAQRQVAESLRAAFWWEGNRLVPLARAKRFRAREVCLIKLTSGTTGRPRPLVFTAGQMLADARQVTRTMGIRPRDLNYALIPLGHSYGLGNLSIPLLAQGVPLVCGSAALPHAIATDFAKWKPSVFPGVPTLWRALAASDVSLESLRLGISAGAPLSVEVATAFAGRFGRQLHSFYGSSETGGITYDRTGGGALAGNVGTAMQGVKLAVVRGRLSVSSAAVLTHGHRHRNGGHGKWLMADGISFDAKKRLTLLGRRGMTVKIAGRRINLAEVAARLRQLSGVREVWVGVEESGEPVLGAAVVADRSIAELRNELQQSTATWKVPKRWLLLTEFPVSGRGKVDTRALQARVFSSSVT